MKTKNLLPNPTTQSQNVTFCQQCFKPIHHR